MSKPEAIVGLLRRGERFLVIRRGAQARSPGFWSPPSGTIEPGERQEDTVIREMREELGIDVKPTAKIWECCTDDGSFLLHWWSADLPPDEMSPDPGEVAEIRWVTAEEFLRLGRIFEGDREFVRTVLPTLV